MTDPTGRTSGQGQIRRSTAQLVVSVGTDHHPFDRLTRWIDDWREQHPEVIAVVQVGTSEPSRHGGSRELIPHQDLLELFRRAIAVVSHGGPSTVMDARMTGRLPIVVPRDPDFGEHVDDHQLRFAEHLSRHGVAVVVYNQDELFAAIDRAFSDPESFAVAVDDAPAAGVHGFGQVVDRLLATRTPILPTSSDRAAPNAIEDLTGESRPEESWIGDRRRTAS